MKSPHARALYEKGITSVADLAGSSPDDIFLILRDSAPFVSGKAAVMTSTLSRTACRLVSGAQQLLGELPGRLDEKGGN